MWKRTSIITVAFDLAIGDNGEDNKDENGGPNELGKESVQEIALLANGRCEGGAKDDCTEHGAQQAAGNLEDPVAEHVIEAQFTTQEEAE